MDRLRKTLSFRRKKKTPEASKPHQWQEDEKKVREGTCSFQVKYLGCLEVFESRGMQVCEEAVKILRVNMKKATRFSFRKKPRGSKPVFATLYISGDSLRVVEDRSHVDAVSRITSGSDELNKGLIVDQTIEKVSFCAPDRNHEKAFAYICRDGTTRRWMCHGFLALKESGERLSHAVGCAFAVCLEKKQKRERDAVQVTFSDDKTTFTRLGSFRQATLTERMVDPQSAITPEPVSSKSAAIKPVETSVRERPQATPNAFLRLGSFREFPKLSKVTSPFKRQLSLRLNELPSTVDRQQHDFQNPAIATGSNSPTNNNRAAHATGGLSLASALTDARMAPTGNGQAPADSSKHAVTSEAFDPIAAMCQQLTQGLTTMTGNGADGNVSFGGGPAAKHPQQHLPQPRWTDNAKTSAASAQPVASASFGWSSQSHTSMASAAVSSGGAAAMPSAGVLPPRQWAGAPTGGATPQANQPGAAGGFWLPPSSSTAAASSFTAASSSSLQSAMNRPSTAPGGGGGTGGSVRLEAMPRGAMGPASDSDPFDAAWAMRTATNSSTNPFLPPPPGQQRRRPAQPARDPSLEPTAAGIAGAPVTKSFEMRM